MKRILSFLALLSLLLSSKLFASSSDNWPAAVLFDTLAIPSTHKISYTTIRNLRNQGQLSEAKNEAQLYLLQYPNDVDVLLLLGLIYLQENNLPAAEKNLKTVLDKVPTYMDARVALIRINISQARYQQALVLIKEGLKQQPNQAELRQYQLAIAKRELVLLPLKEVVNISSQPPEKVDLLPEIKQLRAAGKLLLAQQKAVNYLKDHQDVDINLMLGLIELQLKNYAEAERQFQQVLVKVPTYLDARIALIKVQLMKKNYPEAKRLLNEGLKFAPGHQKLLVLSQDLMSLTHAKTTQQVKKETVDPLVVAIEKLMAEKHYYQAQSSLSKALIFAPDNINYRLVLADVYLKQSNDLQALLLMRQSLRLYPNSLALLLKKAEINYTMRAYAQSAHTYQQALNFDNNNTKAQGELKEIASISPRYLYGRNELGISSDNAYVNDLHSIWDYSTLYYGRDGDFGHFNAKINYASRLHQSAQQYELDLSPRLNRDIYFDFTTAYSDNPALFPNFAVSGESYVNLYNIVEISGGSRFAKISHTYFTTYTGSLNFYPFNFWLNFRPYFFVPKDIQSRSLLYTFRVRRYFSTDDHYIGLGVGAGRSPDLADLLTVNFLVIRNNFINANYTFPIFNHHLVVDLGAGYQRWQYPSQLVRRLYDGSIGFRYRF